MTEEEEKYDEDFYDLIKDDNSIQSNSQDSFAKGISKAYEEHKKTESKINHRPISSYQVNNNNVVNNLNKEDSIKSKQKPQSAHPITSSNNSVNNKSESISSNNEKESDKNFDEIITDLRNFIKQKNIKKNDFIDNENIFLTYEDFKSLLQSIHYIIPKKYLKVLFNYKNEGTKDNYIYLSKFLKYLYDDINESEISNSNISISNTSIKSNNNHSLNKIKNRPYSSKQINKNNTINNIGKNVYEMTYLNEQFSKFNKDIKDIIKLDGNKIYNYSNNNSSKISKENNNFRKRPITGIPKSSNSSKININSKPIILSKKNSLKSINSKLKEEEDYIKQELNKEEEQKKEKYNLKNIIEKRKLEAKKENEKIKRQFEKRRNDYKNEIFEKCVEMNKICETLKIEKRYKIISKHDELYCVFKKNKNDKKIGEMDIKNFEIEYRRLNKLYQQKDIKETYATNEQPPKKDMETLLKERQNEKNEKKKDIKEVLIEAVKLKTKLKNQLDNLKSKVKIEEKVVIEQLLKAGIEIEKKNDKK